MNIEPSSIRLAAVAAAALLAWLVARFALPGRSAPERRAAAALVAQAVLLGLVVARLAYAVRWWQAYLASPGSLLAMGDGGFYWWAGLPVALAWVLWRIRGMRPLWLPMLAPVAVGFSAWGLMHAGLAAWQPDTPSIPHLTLHTLEDAQAVELRAYANKPMVLNIWATWCPPCRRELPAFEHAQRTYPGVNFVFADQGESAAVVRAYLQRQGLQLHNVLLDRSMATMRATGVKALPNTLFFDARGHLVQTHVGELPAARMQDVIENQLLR